VSATEAYAQGGFASLVLDGKRQLVEEYGPRSAFWQEQGANLDPAVGAAVRSSLLPSRVTTTRSRSRAAAPWSVRPRCAGIASS